MVTAEQVVALEAKAGQEVQAAVGVNLVALVAVVTAGMGATRGMGEGAEVVTEVVAVAAAGMAAAGMAALAARARVAQLVGLEDSWGCQQV